MPTEAFKTDLQIIHVIVNFGLGSKVIQKARQCGVSGATVLLGKGTVNNSILNFLGLTDERKEIVIMATDGETARRAIERLDEEFKFEKPNHGIVFTTSVCALIGTRSVNSDKVKEVNGVQNTEYCAITVIVEKGRAEDVVDSAVKAGAKGGTIINGRGSGIHETQKVFSMEIEPEKEIVLILSKKDQVEAIVQSVREDLKIDEPGNGIIYVQSVLGTYGLYDS